MKLYSFLAQPATLLGILWLITGCSDRSPATTGKDNTIMREVVKTVTDTALVHPPEGSVTAEDNPEPDLKDIRQDYYKECRDTVRIDTQTTYHGKDLTILFRHYSTNDSAIRLPQVYLKIYSLKEFVTHHFESALRVKVEDSILLDIIRHEQFKSYLDGYLASYGTIRFPHLKLLPDRLRINYSYTIPLTDVGVPVAIEYPYYKKFITRDEYP